MPRKTAYKCYFGCFPYKGKVHRFPPQQYPHTEKFDLWKMVLSKIDREKGDNYICNNIRICDHHFEQFYRTPAGYLTKNAVPTLNIASTSSSVMGLTSCGADPNKTSINAVAIFTRVSTSTTAEFNLQNRTCDNAEATFGQGKDDTVLHSFPNPHKNMGRYIEWTRAVGISISSLDPQYVYRNRRVCHAHFETKYLTWTRRLSPNAIPTLFLPGSEKEILHKFPNPNKEPERFRTWIYNIGGSVLALDNGIIFKRRRVCHLHFQAQYRTRSKFLSADAIPRLCLQGASTDALISDREPSTSQEAILHRDVIQPLNTSSLLVQDVAESCADAGDSCPRDEPEVENTDICDDVDDDNDDSDTLVESNVCRVCLALDVKMYDLKDIELREMFQNITGIAVTENNHSILERLCWECVGRLKAAAAFRNKALLSDALLQGLANSGEQIRKNYITLIKENEDYLKSAGALSTVEVFHTVQIDPENESVPPISDINDTEIVQNTFRIDSIELDESVIEEDTNQMNIEDESTIEAPIETEIVYDHICPNTVEENRNIFIKENPVVSNNITFREDNMNSAYSSPLPGCSHVEQKDSIPGYLPKTPSNCDDQIRKPVIKITKRDLISRIVFKKPEKLIGISKKTSNLKLVKKTQVKANTLTDEEYQTFEDFEF